MSLAKQLARELLSNKDEMDLLSDLSREVSRFSLGMWFTQKMIERDFVCAGQVLSDMVSLGYECDELAVRLYHAENAKVRRVV